MSEQPQRNLSNDDETETEERSNGLRRKFPELIGIGAVAGLAGCADEQDEPPDDGEGEDDVEEGDEDGPDDDPLDDDPVEDDEVETDDDDGEDEGTDVGDDPLDDDNAVDDEDDDPTEDETDEQVDEDQAEDEPTDDEDPADDDSADDEADEEFDVDDETADDAPTGVVTVSVDGRVADIVSEVEDAISDEEVLHHAVSISDRVHGTATVVFHIARVDTQLLQNGWSAGIDIPHRIVIYEADSDEAFLSYTDPKYLFTRHKIDDDETAELLSERLDELIGQIRT
ncbi:hypothetical protein [Natronorarus salvus]|uniref:hypothetical protein n=1 Tax=Natronorarus salvus TaxID=3117733 RepID=UPI002F269914